jgi:hypothetical protein
MTIATMAICAAIMITVMIYSIINAMRPAPANNDEDGPQVG